MDHSPENGSVLSITLLVFFKYYSTLTFVDFDHTRETGSQEKMDHMSEWIAAESTLTFFYLDRRREWIASGC